MKNILIRYRIISFCIDLFLLSFVACLIALFITIFRPMNESIKVTTCIVFPIALLKDIMGGASIGKRVFNLYVGNQSKPIQPVKKYKLILRNLTCLIWPLEAILLLTTGKRIGDRITNTTVYSKRELELHNNPLQKNDLFRYF